MLARGERGDLVTGVTIVAHRPDIADEAHDIRDATMGAPTDAAPPMFDQGGLGFSPQVLH